MAGRPISDWSYNLNHLRRKIPSVDILKIDSGMHRLNSEKPALRQQTIRVTTGYFSGEGTSSSWLTAAVIPSGAGPAESWAIPAIALQSDRILVLPKVRLCRFFLSARQPTR